MAESTAPIGVTRATCPGLDTLREFLAERLTAACHGAVLDHVAGCAACDETLVQLAASGTAAALGAPLAPDPDPAGAVFVARLAACEPPRRPLPRTVPEIPGVAGLEPVGRGGMGVVYRGRDLATGAAVAVKVMWSVGGLTEAAHDRARREAETLARIDDPGIVRVIRAGRCEGGPLEPEGVPYIVMEWIDGETLQRKHGSKSLPVREAAAVIRDLGRVLARVHALGIVHRDVKPANVFLVPGPKPGTRATPKLVDFGLARRESADGSSLSAWGIAGTPGYMAPEQSRTDGTLGPIGPASDVHGLGATLFFLLAGRPPLDGRGEDVTIATTTGPRLDWHAGGRPPVPVDLRTIVEKCLRSSPLCRYPSAGEVADDLDRFLAGLPIRARQAGVGERLVTWSRRHPGWCVSAFLAALLLGAAFTGASLHTARLDRANRVAHRARMTAEAALEKLTGTWAQRMMARGDALDGGDRAFLGEVRDMYRSWSVADDPLGALRFRAEGLGQIARIFANLDEENEAITLFGEARAALDEYQRRGGDAGEVNTLRLVLLRDQTQMFMRYKDGPRHGELVARLRMLLDDPAAHRASSATERSIVTLARLGLLILSIDRSVSGPSGGMPPQTLAGIEEILVDLEELERTDSSDPAAAIGLIEGLIVAGTALEWATGPEVAIARLRRAEDCAARALDTFRTTEFHDRFRRHRCLALAIRCDLELASGLVADSLVSARQLVFLLRSSMEHDETADLFYRGEYIEAVIREARAAAAQGASAECIETVETAVELAARSVTEQPAVFVHAGRLAKVLETQSFVLENAGRKADAAGASRRVAATLVPWRDSPVRAAWTRGIIETAHLRSGRLRMEVGDFRGAIDDGGKLLAMASAEQRADAARLLLAAGRAAERPDVVAKAFVELLRHDAASRGKILGTLGIALPAGPPEGTAADAGK